ncbi:ABC transporter permease [Zoogloea sp.]|uniref:ABC transporter permease n=1 Tax=Zoogloea sp. TaxID=49181 RepID=UPI002637B0F5|nr:ABC transporter permease [Zoogloea sp.]
MISKLTRLAAEVYASRSVLGRLVRQQLILRYRRTVLGYLWTLVNPLLMMSVMAMVFATIFKEDVKVFAIFLFAGMIPWNCFNSIVVQSGGAFINNEGLIKKIYIPKILFPLSVSLGVFIDSILSFFALFAIILAVGGKVSTALFFVPVAYILLFLFSFGVGLVFSVATVFFRDLQYVIQIAMQGLFFLTPVLYKKDVLSGGVSNLVALNPVVPFIELFRAPLFQAKMPSDDVILHASLISIVSIILGLVVLLGQEKKVVFRL